MTRRDFLAGVALAAANPMVPRQETPGRTPLPLAEEVARSHVGSLYGPISRVRDAYGWAMESFTRDRFHPEDHAAWRRRMTERVFHDLHYSPRKADFDAEIVERVDCGTYVREKVYFNTTPELRVPAYVLVPQRREGRLPGIVALHDHGGVYCWGKEKLVKLPEEHPHLARFKAQCYGGRSIADDFAEAGYVVAVIDMFYWGERRLRLSGSPASPGDPVPDTLLDRVHTMRSSKEELVARTMESAGFTWPGLILWDDIRTLDYLASRPEVDPARLGCIGLSVGGWRAAHLTALDERVKAGVDVCWMTSFRDIQARHTIYTVGFTKLVAGLYRALDMPDVVSLAAPRALLCINGSKDSLFPVDTGVRAAYRTLEEVYGKLGAADKFRGHLYDTPHEFNLEMQREARSWLAQWV